MSEKQFSKPNLLLVGMPRCASTALSVALGKHPDIFVCSPKEPHFLAMHGFEREIRGPGTEEFRRESRLDHDGWSRLFEGRNERYLVDASVTSATYPDVSIPNIKRYCDPTTKILVMLRNPVERAYSSYMYCVARGWESASFEQCLVEEHRRIDDGWQHLWFLKHLSRYRERLSPFQDAFSEANIHVMVSEEFSIAPEQTMARLYEFLDIAPVEIDASARLNSGGKPRNTVVRGLSTLVHGQPLLRKGLRLLTTRNYRELLRSRHLVKVDMAKDTRLSLERSFEDTRDWVQEKLGRRLPEWD